MVLTTVISKISFPFLTVNRRLFVVMISKTGVVKDYDTYRRSTQNIVEVFGYKGIIIIIITKFNICYSFGMIISRCPASSIKILTNFITTLKWRALKYCYSVNFIGILTEWMCSMAFQLYFENKYWNRASNFCFNLAGHGADIFYIYPWI